VLGRARQPQRRQWCGKRARGRVTFARTVQVTEFARALDGGGTVPGDGSRVTLGLGRRLRVTSAPLICARPVGERPIEERAWVPSCERVRLLRAFMGDARYTAAWLRHREEVVRVARTRKQSNEEDLKDRLLMPTSFKEARQRAEALGRLAREEEASCCDLKPHKLIPSAPLKPYKARCSGLINRRNRAPRAGDKKQRRAAPKRKWQGLEDREDEVSEESSAPSKRCGKQSCLMCHRCALPIAAGGPDGRCTCLAAPARAAKAALPKGSALLAELALVGAAA